MRRVAAIVVVAALLGGAIAHAGAAEPGPPSLSAKLVSCTNGPTGRDRVAVFTGSMPSIEGAHQMAMRFALLERRPRSGGFRPVPVPGMGWQRSRRDPRLPGFIVTKRVDGLAAPRAYRAVVRFRWYDASGRVIRRAQRATAVCRQFDPRPDLVVTRLGVVPGPEPQLVRYVVRLRNRGRGDAAVPFATVLTVNRVAQPRQTLPTLGGGGRATVSFVAPRCAPGSSVRVVVDADRAIDEVSEGNNGLVRPCLAGAARTAATLARR